MEKVEAKRVIRYSDKVGSVSWVLSEHAGDIGEMFTVIFDVEIIKRLVVDLIKEEAVLNGTTAYKYINMIEQLETKSGLARYLTGVIRGGRRYPTVNVPYVHKARNQII